MEIQKIKKEKMHTNNLSVFYINRLINFLFHLPRKNIDTYELLLGSSEDL